MAKYSPKRKVPLSAPNGLGGPFMPGKWSPLQANKADENRNIMTALKRLRVKLSAEICSKCPRFNRDDFGVFMEGSVYVYCGLRRIGESTDATIYISARGIPLDCPYTLEYLMWNEQRKDEEKGKVLLEKVLAIIKNRRKKCIFVENSED